MSQMEGKISLIRRKHQGNSLVILFKRAPLKTTKRKDLAENMPESTMEKPSERASVISLMGWSSEAGNFGVIS